MIDTTTRKPPTVSTDGTVGPYLRLTAGQLDAVRRLFDENQVRYAVEENVISVDGGPEIAVIDLGRKGDARAVQALLDSIDRG